MRTTQVEGLDEAAALALLAAGDEDTARIALARLRELGSPFLYAYLRGRVDRQDAEDVIQETWLRVWRFRGRFQNRGVAAWYALLYRTAANCRVDLFRQKGSAVSVPEIPEAPPEDADLAGLEEAISAFSAVVEAGRLYSSADVLWLGLDPELAAETHTRQLLAAQLFYLDGEPWEGVLRLLGDGPAGEAPLDRARLDEWLAHPGVLRLLAYQAVYYSNERLTLFLLRLPDTGPGADVLDRLLRDAAGGEMPVVGGWTGAETAIVQWRYRYALLPEQIRAREDCALNAGELDTLFDRCRARFPFGHEMAALLARLGPVPGAREALRTAGLWQRLAFQYCYSDCLPHRDIRDRAQPAADLVDYTLTLGMLNVWLSNGRLLKRLARHCAGTEGASADG